MPKKEAKPKEVKVDLPKGQKMSDEDVIVEDTRPVPKEWAKVTLQEVEVAQEAGKLIGFDPDKMIALIRE